MGKIDINLLEKYRILSSQDKRDIITIVGLIDNMLDSESKGLSKVRSQFLHEQK